MDGNRPALTLAAGLLLLASCSSQQSGDPVLDTGLDTGLEASVEASTVEAGSDSAPADAGGDVEPASEPVLACPGAQGCAANEGPLLGGAAAVAISPSAYEQPRVAYLREERFCPTPTPLGPQGLKRCGALVKKYDSARADCGLDGLCPGDQLKTLVACDDATPCPAPLSCELADKRCTLTYSAPDADGSEADGVDDWFLDCGRDRICPCLDAAGQPAYFGAGETCLSGHVTNPDYEGPDSDGSEGNGAFDGIWLGGFSTNIPMLGKHDDVWARALVLRSGQTTVALVSLDLVGVFYDDVRKIRAAVAAKLKDAAEVDYVLVSSTHNHEGPDTMGLWGPDTASGVVPDYFAQMVDGAAKSVLDALAGLRQVKLTAGQTGTGVDGYLRDSRDPRIFNDQLLALKLDDAATGETVATLVNWSNHPEALSDTNNYVSSDFCHYLRQGVEQAIPAAGSLPELPPLGGVAIFLQGTIGGLMTQLGVDVPARGGTLQHESGWGKAAALGTNLAVKAREALAAGEAITGATVSVWAKRVKLGVANNRLLLAFLAKIVERETVTEDDGTKLFTELALVRVGPVTLFSFPGEVAPEMVYGGYDGSLSFGREIISESNKAPPDLSKAPQPPYLIDKLPGKYKLPVGLGNDELGYIIPAYNFVVGDPPYLEEAPGDHYEETNSIGPHAEKVFLDAHDELIGLASKP